MIPKVWLDFYNGPQAGFISIESAAGDTPWLVGPASSKSVAVGNFLSR